MLGRYAKNMSAMTNTETQQLAKLQRTKCLDPSEFMLKWKLEIKKQLLADNNFWDMPECGKDFLRSKGIDIKSSFLYSNGWTYDIPNNFDGVVITLSGAFYEYEFEYSEDLSHIKEAQFSDITGETNLYHNNKGIPKTREAIALEVFKQWYAQQIPETNPT